MPNMEFPTTPQTNVVRTLSILTVLVSLVLAAAVGLPRVKRATEKELCPERDGQFEYLDDCSLYVQCDGGQPTVMPCQPGFLFNPSRGYCDWPRRVTETKCLRIEDRDIQLGGDGDLQDICGRSIKVMSGGPVLIAHPKLCNAFFMCVDERLYPPCSFCPERMYFNENLGMCVQYEGRGFDVVCGGKEFIPHDQQVRIQLSDLCWPFSDGKNPFQESEVQQNSSEVTENTSLPQ